MRELNTSDFPDDSQLLSLCLLNGMKPTFETLLKSIASIGTEGVYDFVVEMREVWLNNGNIDEKFNMEEVIQTVIKYERVELFNRFVIPILENKKQKDTKFEEIENRIEQTEALLLDPSIHDFDVRRLEYLLEIHEEQLENVGNEIGEIFPQWERIIVWIFSYCNDSFIRRLVHYIDDIDFVARMVESFGTVN